MHQTGRVASGGLAGHSASSLSAPQPRKEREKREEERREKSRIVLQRKI